MGGSNEAEGRASRDQACHEEGGGTGEYYHGDAIPWWRRQWWSGGAQREIDRDVTRSLGVTSSKQSWRESSTTKLFHESEPKMASSSTAAAAACWFDKNPNDMSMTELKLAISNAGLCGESEGFVERSEFITLLNSHRDVFCGQDECPVCFLPMNFGMKSILLPCKHRLCENCLTSIVSREDASCVCPMCRASVSETSLAIGMKNAGLTASALFGGYNGAVKTRILDRAEAQFREALRRDPHHAGFLTTLADLVLDKGDAREAGVLCRRAIYYEPANYVGFASLGHVLTAMDDLEGAIRCYEKALSLKEHPDVVSNLVCDASA